MPEIASLFTAAIEAHRQGELDKALSGYEAVLRLDDNHADALHLSGMIAHQSGDSKSAIELISKAIGVNPGVAAVHNNLGEAFRVDVQLQRALSCYQQALRLDPQYAPAKFNTGLVYEELGDSKAAIAAYQAVVGIDTGYSPGWKALASALLADRQLSASILAWNEYLALKSDDAVGLVGLGVAKLGMGLMDEALASARKALKVAPENAGAWQLLAKSRRYSNPLDVELVTLQRIVDSGVYSQDSKSLLSFSLAKMLDDCGEYAAAFEHYSIANTGHVQAAETAASAMVDLVAELQESFTPAFFEHRKQWGNASSAPTFIVGMPRSGTTLVEQILSMHPGVSTRGELKVLDQVIDNQVRSLAPSSEFPAVIADFSANDFKKIATSYLNEISPEEGVQCVTDKMPFNSRYVGMIQILFPDAHIIYCDRDAKDTCLSNYFQAFEGNPQSRDLYQLGRYYHAQQQMMTYWNEMLPGRIHTVVYEELVSGPTQVVGDLLQYLDLTWDDQCLNFHQSKKDVYTASASQVREPIYQRAMHRWQAYEAFLDPLIKGLNGT